MIFHNFYKHSISDLLKRRSLFLQAEKAHSVHVNLHRADLIWLFAHAASYDV